MHGDEVQLDGGGTEAFIASIWRIQASVSSFLKVAR
jgi:hypothetical protein